MRRASYNSLNQPYLHSLGASSSLGGLPNLTPLGNGQPQ